MKNSKIIVALLVIIIILLVGIIGFGGYKYMNLQSDNDKLSAENKTITGELNKQKTEEQKVETKDNTNDETYTSTYLDILGGKHKYINKDNKEVYIKKLADEAKDNTKTIEYAILDMDENGSKELVARVYNSFDSFALILHYEEGVFYGFEDTIRGFAALKTNGYYIGSEGADTNTISQSSFNKNIRNEKVVAKQDNDTYTINDKKVSKDEYAQFINNLKDVSWIKY